LDRTAGIHRLDRIQDQVEQGLPQQLLVGFNRQGIAFESPCSASFHPRS